MTHDDDSGMRRARTREIIELMEGGLLIPSGGSM
jgi:hypothetical protein